MATVQTQLRPVGGSHNVATWSRFFQTGWIVLQQNVKKKTNSNIKPSPRLHFSPQRKKKQQISLFKHNSDFSHRFSFWESWGGNQSHLEASYLWGGRWAGSKWVGKWECDTNWIAVNMKSEKQQKQNWFTHLKKEKRKPRNCSVYYIYVIDIDIWHSALLWPYVRYGSMKGKWKSLLWWRQEGETY